MAETTTRDRNMTNNAVTTGEFVAQHLNNGDVPDEQIQPNGVDLTVGEVYRTSGVAEFTESGYDKPDRTFVEPRPNGYYRLHPGQYPIVYGEKVEIPDGYVARVYPRSRLMRSGLHLTSALWDTGYEGIGEGLLRVPRSIEGVRIKQNLPIAQMTFISAAEAEDYDGSHQEERLTASNYGTC
jgi:deoxycytidine triphosphate deaminase